MRLLIVLLLISGVSIAAHGQDPETASGDADQGKEVFNDRGCYQCHGFEGHGGAAGARIAPQPMPFETFAGYVRRPAGQMPPYTRTVLSDGDLTDIYAFLLSIPEPPPVDSIPALSE